MVVTVGSWELGAGSGERFALVGFPDGLANQDSGERELSLKYRSLLA
jgi:hypothetical protein